MEQTESPSLCIGYSQLNKPKLWNKHSDTLHMLSNTLHIVDACCSLTECFFSSVNMVSIALPFRLCIAFNVWRYFGPHFWKDFIYHHLISANHKKGNHYEQVLNEITNTVSLSLIRSVLILTKLEFCTTSANVTVGPFGEGMWAYALYSITTGCRNCVTSFIDKLKLFSVM